MAGQGFVYSEELLPEWVIAPTAILYSELILVEWAASSQVREYSAANIVEWVPPPAAVIESTTLLVEWELTTLISVLVEALFVEWEPESRMYLRSTDQIIEWLPGNTLYAEPGNIHVQGGNTPILGVLAGAGTGIDVKPYAWYQLADTDNAGFQEGLEPPPDGLNFEGGPLPPPGPNNPPVGPLPHPTIQGAEAEYGTLNGSPTVGPDLID